MKTHCLSSCGTGTITCKHQPLRRKKLDGKTPRFVEEKVKPLLESRCYKCHGPKVRKLKGGLSLDIATAKFLVKKQETAR